MTEDKIATDQGTVWGFELGDGSFVQLPKLPMIRAGLTAPPFAVSMPDGTTRHIVEKSLITEYGETIRVGATDLTDAVQLTAKPLTLEEEADLPATDTSI